MLVNVIGLAPAEAGNGKPFEECASGKRLIEWLSFLDPEDEHQFVLSNLCSSKLEGNRLPRRKDIEQFPDICKGEATIACGVLAYKELAKQGFTRLYCLPHPSGLNRKLNDSEQLNKYLEDCKRWLQLQQLE